jgi:hypothetical protein
MRVRESMRSSPHSLCACIIHVLEVWWNSNQMYSTVGYLIWYTYAHQMWWRSQQREDLKQEQSMMYGTSTSTVLVLFVKLKTECEGHYCCLDISWIQKSEECKKLGIQTFILLVKERKRKVTLLVGRTNRISIEKTNSQTAATSHKCIERI